jgi:hypothetical protein
MEIATHRRLRSGAHRHRHTPPPDKRIVNAHPHNNGQCPQERNGQRLFRKRAQKIVNAHLIVATLSTAVHPILLIKCPTRHHLMRGTTEQRHGILIALIIKIQLIVADIPTHMALLPSMRLAIA